MRVYLPATLPALAGVLSAGGISQSAPGYAVTPALREWYSSGDIEELEYVALMHAARASLRLLAADPSARKLRVVLAAELPDANVLVSGGFEDPALVEVAGPVGLRDIKSGHVDDQETEADIAAAVAALPAADAGDEDAQFVVDGAEGFELLWYATQELDALL
jgi:hypothetical protein